MRKIKSILVIGLIVMLFATRFINLHWGLPYPFHPDERNMADAIMSLNLAEGFNPHFFAYGQFPLYLAYFFILMVKLPVSFIEATLTLRIISAIASILTVFVCIKIIDQLTGSKVNRLKSYKLQATSYMLLIFSPVLIQLAHFGTTESLLMFFYTLIIFISLKKLQGKISLKQFTFINVLVCGLAVATKVSSLIFLILPVFVICWEELKKEEKNFLNLFFCLVLFIVNVLIVTIIFSPYNFIDFSNFLTSFNYESAVALGKLPVFYTQQFFGTLPFLFQLINIFSYALGWPVFILFIAGFIFLPWKKELLFLRLALLVYFLPTAIIYTKWTRFLAPIYPLAIIFAILFFDYIFLLFNRLIGSKKSYKLQVTSYTLCILCCLPGILYLNIYLQTDVRIQASKWINQYIPEGSYILQEAGNTVNLPLLPEKNFKIAVFDFYNLDNDQDLQQEFKQSLKQADYIIVPSRRVFSNYTCLNPKSKAQNPNQTLRIGGQIQSLKKIGYQADNCFLLEKKYPFLNQYYDELFSGKMGFEKVAEFSTAIFPDEQAEETWSVFDHPVIRIYEKLNQKSKTCLPAGRSKLQFKT